MPSFTKQCEIVYNMTIVTLTLTCLHSQQFKNVTRSSLATFKGKFKKYIICQYISNL